MNRLTAAWRLLTRGLPAAAAPTHRRTRTGAYAAADNNRLTQDWLPTGLTADDEIRYSLWKIRNRTRDMERNNPLVKQFLRLLSVNVIGPDGIKLQSDITNNNDQANEAFRTKIEAAWALWSEQPTRDGRGDLSNFQRLAIKTVARDGEAFVRIYRSFPRNPFGFALELIDPDLIDETMNTTVDGSGREIRLGVEVDSDNRPVAYHGWNKPARLTMGTARQRVSYPADEIIHLYDPDRVNQTRGVSWMTSIMMSMRHASAYSEAELVAARTGASKMGFFQKRPDTPGGLVEDDNNPGVFTTNADPGTFGIIPEGYEFAQFAPSHPSTAFESFMKAQHRAIATGLGVSYNGLASDLEGVNYSSIRAGLLVERDMWRTLQEWWIASFLRPVFREWLNMALLTKAVTLDSRDARKFLAARWIPRGWAWVDPLKDTQAGILAIGAGLASRTSLLAEQGMDFEDVVADIAEEDADAKEAGIDISIDKGPAAQKATVAGEEGGGGAPGATRNGHAHSRITFTTEDR